MARTCERPGCSLVAEVAYGFQAEPYVIWLDRPEAPDGDRRRAGVLCRRHADAMVVPIGWTLDDRRDPAPRLFATPGERDRVDARPVDDTAGMRRRNRLAPARVEAPPATRGWTEVSLFDPADFGPAGESRTVGEAGVSLDAQGTVGAPDGLSDEHDADAGTEPEAEPVAPWRPVFDPADDLDGLLAPTSPLLSRAFRGERPRTEEA